MRTSPNLPLELLYNVLDMIAYTKDHDTLMTCSQVSRAFRYICGRHIFETIGITNSRCNEPSFYPILPLDDVKDILETNPAFATYIKTLYLMDESLWKFANPNLPLVLSQLPNLNTLFLGSDSQTRPLDWKIMSQSLRMSFERLLGASRLTHLNLDYVKNFPILWILATCTSLQALTVSSASIESQSQLESIGFPQKVPVLQLRTFALDLEASLDVARILITSKKTNGQPVIDFTSLESLQLSLEVDAPEHIEIMKMYLAVASNVTSLCLHVEKYVVDSFRFFDCIHPSALKTLQYLELSFVLDEESNDPYLGAYEELEKLASVGCPLQSFTVQVYLYLYDGFHYLIKQEIWDKLNEVLTVKNFVGLRRVSVEVCFIMALEGHTAENVRDKLTGELQAVFNTVRNEPRIQFLLSVDYVSQKTSLE